MHVLTQFVRRLLRRSCATTAPVPTTCPAWAWSGASCLLASGRASAAWRSTRRHGPGQVGGSLMQVLPCACLLLSAHITRRACA